MFTRSRLSVFVVIVAAGLCFAVPGNGQVANVKVVTDASPDYYDLPSMVHSITSRWATPEEKVLGRVLLESHCPAPDAADGDPRTGMQRSDPAIQRLWLHNVAARSPEPTAPSGMQLALKAKYWDIAQHTVAEVQYDGRWHMYDNSMSALYTLCDGRTLAGVEDIGKPGACAASGGKVEPGHIAKYHCLYSTSKNASCKARTLPGATTRKPTASTPTP